ncbi:MAG: GDSL-type esterase/lipase family protein [Elusimicrobiota bacterium]|jgi:beta-glucosidase
MLKILLLASVLSAAQPSTPAWEAEPRVKDYSWKSVAVWYQQHEDLVQRAKAGDIDILMVGDSITEGWRASPLWEKRYLPMKAANFGIGGDNTQNVLWRLTEGKEIEGLSPKVATLLIGANNLGLNWDSAEDTAKGIAAVIKTLRQRLPDAKILLFGVFPCDEQPTAQKREQIAEINRRIAPLADGEHVRFLDLGAKFLAPDGTISKEIMPDFLHLSEKGYEIWSSAMEPVLAGMLARPGSAPEAAASTATLPVPIPDSIPTPIPAR